MKLTYEQIASITSGAVKSTVTEEGIRFFRCTEKQTDAWTRRSAVLGERAMCSTGIRLDFHTDSGSFGFENTAGDKFDLYINGVITDRIRPGVPGSYSAALPDGDTRITLIFPSHGKGAVLKSVTLDDGAYFVRHEYSRKILFVGDSITQGWNSVFDSLSYAWRTVLHYDADCVMNAIGGAVFYPEANDSIDFDPDTVIVSLGTNDYDVCKTQDELKDAADGVFSFLEKEYAGARLVAITPIWRADEDKPRKVGTFSDVCDIVANSAAGHGFEVLRGYGFVPHITKLYADAVLHPNDLGFEFYADSLIKALGD